MPDVIPILIAAPAQPGVSGSPAARPPGPGGLASFKSNLRQALQRGHTSQQVHPALPVMAAVAGAALPPGLASLPETARAVPAMGLPEQAAPPAAEKAHAAPPGNAAESLLLAQAVVPAQTVPPVELATEPALAPVVTAGPGVADDPAAVAPAGSAADAPTGSDPGARAGSDPGARAVDAPRKAGPDLPAQARATEVSPSHGGVPPGWAKAAGDEIPVPPGQLKRETTATSDRPEAEPVRQGAGQPPIPILRTADVRAVERSQSAVAPAVLAALPHDRPAAARTARESSPRASVPVAEDRGRSRPGAGPVIDVSAPTVNQPSRGESSPKVVELRETREVSTDMGSKQTRTVTIPADGTIDFDLGRLVRLAAGDAPKGVMPVGVDLRPTPVERQVVEALRIMPKSDGQHEVHMRLNPPELGEVHIKMLVSEGSASVFMNTQTDVAREAIHAALPHLREVLESRDLKAHELQVSLDGSRTGSQGSGEERRERREEQRPEAGMPWIDPVTGKPRAKRARQQLTQLDVLA